MQASEIELTRPSELEKHSSNGLGLSSSGTPLRIALAFDRETPIDWVFPIVSALRRSGAADVVLFIIHHRLSARLKREQSPLLLRLWRYFDKGFFTKRSEARLLTDACGQLDRIPCLVLNDDDSTQDLRSGNALDEVRLEALDLIVEIGASECMAHLSCAAKYGSWWIPESPYESINLSWFWALRDKLPVFETVLKAGSASGARTRTIHRSFAAVNPFSLLYNHRTKQRKICDLLIGEVTKLQQLISPGRKGAGSSDVDEPSCNRLQPLPTNREVAKFLWHWGWDAARYAVHSRIWKEHWFIAYRSNVGSLPKSDGTMQNFKIVVPPKDRFFADPFLIECGGKNYLFFEDYPFNKGRGIISFVEIDEQGHYTEPEAALTRPYHLSYPCVFEHENEVYMIPETLESRRVELYRALDFPRLWTFEKTLLDGVAAADPTILIRDGKFWLFVAGVLNPNSINEELFLFHSDSLQGTWSPHPLNPIVSDVRRARPAGHLFVHEGQLIRPAQDCSPRYGRAVVFNRVEVLSESNYREVPVQAIGPEWCAGNRGTHTFNQSKSLQVIDGRVLTSKYRHAFIPDMKYMAGGIALKLDRRAAGFSACA
jgi:hypothetical protein